MPDPHKTSATGLTNRLRSPKPVWAFIASLVILNVILAVAVITYDRSRLDPFAIATTTPVPAELAQRAPTAAPAPTTRPTRQPSPTPTINPPKPAATSQPTPSPTPTLVPLSELPERGAIYRAPLLYLQGPIRPDDAAAVIARATAIVGADNIVDNYQRRSDADPFTTGNVRVENAVQFQTGSADIADAFTPTLDLGVALLTLYPDVTMIIEGHTDDEGSTRVNQRLSQTRAQAVATYLIDNGIKPDRLEPIGYGEQQPIATNQTALGRAINRRIEVQLNNLLTTAATNP